MQKIVVVDNYDSFTYNIVHVVEKILKQDVVVVRNDMIKVNDVAGFDGIILSPGPGLPANAGVMPDLIEAFHRTKKILGICLGHQAIAEFFGAKLKNLNEVYHGVDIPMSIIERDILFDGIPERVNVGRYHSWVIEPTSLVPDLKVLAKDDEGNIMAIAHKVYNIKGVQFHPESVLTSCGEKIMSNWLFN